MKLTYISFGHIDVSLPLLKNLFTHYGFEIDYYILLPNKSPFESVLDFSEYMFIPKLYSSAETESYLPFWFKSYINNGIKVHLGIYPDTSILSFKTHFWFLKLIHKIKDLKNDIIHISGTSAFIFNILYSFSLRKIPKIITIHDFEPHLGEMPAKRHILNIQKIVSRNHSIIIQNRIDYKALKFRFPDKSFNYVPIGNLEFYSEMKGNCDIISDILFFGRIYPYKGIEYLIEAVKEINSRGIKTKTIIAGMGEIYFNTGSFDELNILLINRYITNDELVSLILGTKIVVCPYIEATQSGVILTSFALNKPVIASDVGSFPEVIKDGINGFLIPPKDAEALAKKIQILLDRPSLLRNMSENISSLICSGEYSWDQITKNIKELYFSVLKL